MGYKYPQFVGIMWETVTFLIIHSFTYSQIFIDPVLGTENTVKTNQ